MQYAKAFTDALQFMWGEGFLSQLAGGSPRLLEKKWLQIASRVPGDDSAHSIPATSFQVILVGKNLQASPCAVSRHLSAARFAMSPNGFRSPRRRRHPAPP